MKMRVDFTDEFAEPRVKMENGKIESITFEAPFIVVKKTERGGYEEQTIPVVLSNTIECNYCHRQLPREAFYHSSTYKTGLKKTCIKCSRDMERNRRDRKKREAE